MSEWLELTDYYNNNQIMIRKSATISVNKINEKKTVICALGDGKNFYVVKESYDKVKAMLVRPDMIEIKYNDEDKEQIQKWIEKLQEVPLSVTTVGENRGTIILKNGMKMGIYGTQEK